MAGLACEVEDKRKHAPMWMLLVIMGSAGLLLWLVMTMASNAIVAHTPGASLSLPSSLAGVTESAENLAQLTKSHFWAVLAVFATAYVMKHAFSIPGSSALNVLAGACFGTVVGVPLCAVLTGLGSSCSFLLSREFGQRLINRWNLAPRLQPLQRQIEIARQHGSLFWYLLSLRIVPLSPHWLYNLLAPHASIPLLHFASTAALGQLAYIFVTVRAGTLLATVPLDAALNWQTSLSLLGLAAVSLIPAAVVRRWQKKNHLSGQGEGEEDGTEV